MKQVTGATPIAPNIPHYYSHSYSYYYPYSYSYSSTHTPLLILTLILILIPILILILILPGNITYQQVTGATPTLLVRARGLHMVEQHVVDETGRAVPAALFDIATYLFHNAGEY